jgi:phosphomannomutase/phosphoglucomutase
MEINQEIFRGYDLRGIAGKDLSPEIMKALGKAYATFLYRRQIRGCVVGMDIRESSPAYKLAFIDGLVEMGIEVIDIGLTLTQIMYFSQYKYLSKGGVIITASHNPKEYNGLKMAVGFSDTMVGEDIAELKKIVVEDAFAGWGKPGSRREVDVYPDYKKDLLEKVGLADCGLKIVVDSSCGTTGKFLPDILRGAGCKIIEQNTNLDPSFPVGTPDPTEEAVLKRLAGGVVAGGADLGLAYDADGDRMGVVDQDGKLIWNDLLVAIFAKDILQHMPKSKIVFNVLCSKAVSDTISESGGEPIMWKVGHSFIKQKVREVRAPFGGELSGHFFFGDDFYGYDDGAFSTLRLLAYLKRTGQSLKQAVDSLPKYMSSPEIKLGLADDIKFQFVGQTLGPEVKQILPTATLNSIDGVRADTADEMVIIRASQNGPYITIKFEGRSREQYDNLKVKIANALKKYPEIDWSQGVNTHAFN